MKKQRKATRRAREFWVAIWANMVAYLCGLSWVRGRREGGEAVKRAEIEAAVYKILWFDGRDAQLAISITEALLREQRERWGHVMGCNCRPPRMGPKPHWTNHVMAPGHFDARCAPQEEKDGH